MKIKVIVTRTETQELEADFPLYRYQDVASDLGHPDEYFQRVDYNGAVYTIHRADDRGYDKDEDGDGVTYELSVTQTDFRASNVDYALCRGEYTLTERKFYDMLERARQFIERFPKRPVRLFTQS